MTLQGIDEGLLKQLTTLVDSNRVPHALVIEGGSGEARKALATKLAEALLCTQPEGKPCGNCDSCRKVLAGAHPDVIFVTPEEKKKTLSVEAIRQMRADAYVLPNEGDRKIYIIPEAERMQDYGQNALLKILEEPPSFANFILCCDSKSVLLPTVLSRVAAFNINADATAGVDKKELEQSKEKAAELARALANGNELQLMQAASYFEKNFEELPLTLDALGMIIRDTLVMNSGSNLFLSGQPAEVIALSKRFGNESLLKMTEVLSDLSASIHLYANKNLTLTRLSSCLMTAANQR